MIDDIKQDAAERMAKSVESLTHELAKIRTGRAHPSLLDHIMALREEGTTVLFVEHDINMVRHIADWVTVMAEGKIVAEGQPKSVMNDPAVIDAYLGAHANVDLGDDSVLEDLKEA